ncbi:MAG: polynucleotide adenylyltransferase PcnB [Deltaproteobacteria bacterium]|nr:polynucleotide adenylyltransferase PcnB [Deltaproteobacteria bacterium]
MMNSSDEQRSPLKPEHSTPATGPRLDPTIHRRAIALDRIDPDAVKVVRRLMKHDHQAYLVGGCVRDLLLDRRPKDFDVATSARPGEVRSLFRNCRIIGRRFRLAHILFADRKVIEVATFRKDPDEAREREGVDGGPALGGDDDDILIRMDNVFGEPDEDAARRDFTINALFYDLERSEIIDYVGGMTDVERRVVRTIGDPDIRFREDPVRILRAIKFASRLDLGIDPDVLDAMVVHREELARAARPRLLEEVFRLLRGGAAHRSTWLMWETGALSVVLPELAAFLDDDAPGARAVWQGLQAADEIQRSGRVLSDAVLFAVLLGEPLREVAQDADDPGAAIDGLLQPLVERLVLPRKVRDRVRQAMLVQRKLQTPPRGRATSLASRDFFADALDLYEVGVRAAGVAADSALEAWRAAQQLTGTADSPRPRARRRGGRRRRRVAAEG